MFKRLKEESGRVIDQTPKENDKSDKVVRRAILVHSGPNGEVITFHSADGEIHFDDARIQAIVKKHNENHDKLNQEYGGTAPDGAYQPILDQHASDSNDRIRGRLTGKLEYVKMDVPKVGKNVSCAVGDITFLGDNTVKQVNDGRIYHLSVGIGDESENEETYNTLGETSTVIEPAAAGAMLLEKGQKQEQEGVTMPTAKDYTKRLEANKEKVKKLSALSDDMKKLTTKLDGSSEKVKLAKAQGDVSSRLTKLMKAGKLTPAESKKIDVKKLAALPKEALETVISTYEVREPVINPHQTGSSSAADFADLGKSLEHRQMKRLKNETLKDFKKMGAKVHLEEDADHGKNHEMKSKHLSDDHEDHGHEHKEMNAKHLGYMAECEKHLEEGKHEEAKASLKKMKEHLSHHGLKKMAGEEHGDVKSEDEMKAMDGMQTDIDELKTNLARLAGIVQELTAVEQEEGEHLSEEAEAHKKLEEDAEKKKLEQELKNKK